MSDITAAKRWPALATERADAFRDLLDDAAGLTPAQIVEAACAAGRSGNYTVATLFLRLAEVDIAGLRRVWEARDAGLPS